MHEYSFYIYILIITIIFSAVFYKPTACVNLPKNVIINWCYLQSTLLR